MHDDEFMLVRVRDGAKIIDRLFLTETGISETPAAAHRENPSLAYAIQKWLESERSGKVSFGITSKA